jgi:WD40 repeat protein
MQYPLAALGSAGGGVCVANLESGEMLTAVPEAHAAYLQNSEREIWLLYGEYDCGGVTAIALSGSQLVSGGREGRVKCWSVIANQLILEGEMETGGVVSAVTILEDGRLWSASVGGKLQRWTADGQCELSIDMGVAVLCMCVNEQRHLLLCGTADGGATALNLLTGDKLQSWMPHKGAPPLSLPRTRTPPKHHTFANAPAPLTVAIGGRTHSISLIHDCVYTGGSDGEIRRRWLAASAVDGSDGDGLWQEGREEELLLPVHGGAVVALQAAAEGLLVSGAHNGSLRVWDLAVGGEEGDEPKCLYGLMGYKVWLGSVCADEARLISDGAENTVIMHDFSEGEEEQ